MEKLVLDSSTITTYMKCPRKFYWKYIRHLDFPKKKHGANFGNAIHKALFEFYSTKDNEKALQAFHDNWEDVETDTLRTHDTGRRILKMYFKKHEKEPFKILTLEKGFEIDIAGHTFCGRMDSTINWNNMYLVKDHKTGKNAPHNLSEKYRPDFQMSGYVWAARKLYNLPFKGALINYLQVAKKKKDIFFRAITPREDFELEIFEGILKKLVIEITSKDRGDMEDWDMRWSNCNNFGSCIYKDLCVTDEPERLTFMYDTFVWNPLENLED